LSAYADVSEICRPRVGGEDTTGGDDASGDGAAPDDGDGSADLGSECDNVVEVLRENVYVVAACLL
jgi:hypothetical protein